MLAYNKTWIENRNIRSKVSIWQKKNIISKTKLEEINENYKEEFYSPNFFVRLGLFIFSLILLIAAEGLIGFFTAGNIKTEFGIGLFALIIGSGIILILEQVIIPKKYYQAGIDDAFLYVGLISIIAAIQVWLPLNVSIGFRVLISLPFLITGTIRYNDRLLAVVSFLALLFVVSSFAFESAVGKMTLPFVLMLISVGAYYAFSKLSKKEISIPYKHTFTMLRITCLITLYLAGNYFVVKETNAVLAVPSYYEIENQLTQELDKEIEIMDQELSRLYSELSTIGIDDSRKEEIENSIGVFENKRDEYVEEQNQEREKIIQEAKNQSLPFSWMFIVFTICIPIIYITLGLKNRSRIFLTCGLILTAASVLTIRHYFSIAPVEYALTFGGVILLVLAYMAEKHFRVVRNRITSLKDEELINSNIVLNTEAIISAETYSTTTPQHSNTDFGGGSFGGGGAGGKF